MSEVLRTDVSGAEAVEQTWQQFVPSARLEHVSPRGARFQWVSASTPGLSAVEYELDAVVRSAVAPVDQLMVCRVASRGSWVGRPSRDFDAALPWMCGDQTVQARWQQAARVRAFIFELEWAQRNARRIVGDDTLVLQVADAQPPSTKAGATWERAFVHVLHSLGALSGDDASGIAEGELRRHALAMTLATFPSVAARADAPVQRRGAPTTVRRAIAYIESHAQTVASIDDVAEAAGISTRGLQLAFRRELGVTPAEFLRRVRLSGAHEDIRRDAASTIRDIALRWGFTNAARFTRLYRDTYGRSPGEERRRH